jgi:hypothetical protein
VAITAAYGFMEKCVKGLDSSRLGFTPPMMERYSRALSVLQYPSSSGQTQCDLITGMPERGNEKREHNQQQGNWHSGLVLIHGDADKSHLGFCNISRSKRNSTQQLEVHSNIHSCGYRGQYGCPRLRC